jgi:uncharacterized membrane protein YbhN (UPF0104 family)
LAACILSLGPITYFRSLRFQTILGEKIPGLFSILIATRTLNYFFPARAGEGFRIIACKRRSNVTKQKLLLSLGLESMVEVLVFVLVGLWVSPVFFPKIPLGIPFLASPLLFLLSSRWIKAIGFTLMSDLTDAAMVGFCLWALRLPFGFFEWCTILIAINFAMLIPSPGNFGTLEAGAVIGLHALGVNKTSALAFAILYRAAHTLPITVAYVLILVAQGKTSIFRQIGSPSIADVPLRDVKNHAI